MSNIQAGFARCDITPPNGLFVWGYYTDRRGQTALDPLEANCLAFSDGEKTAVVITFDLGGINQEYGDKLRRVIAEATGLPYEAIYFCCTHTHLGPSIHSREGLYGNDEGYNSVLFRQVADAVNAAIADMSEANFFTAQGEVKGISFIRRFKMKDGSTKTNPGKNNPNIDHPISTPDESLQLVRITREGKEELVLLNFQTHPDVIGGCKYSADWPGHTRRAFEGAVPGTKCVFFNGAQGDTNHLCTTDEYQTPSGYNHSRHMGLSVAGEAMKLYTYAKPLEGAGVDFIQNPIEAPSNRGTAEQMALAKKYIALNEAGRRNEIPATAAGVTVMIAEAHRIKELENGPDAFPLYLNAIKVGGLVFSGIPGEPFTDIGRAIKEKSPFEVTVVCCCANGYEGYFPMQSAYDEGGYEARSSKFAPGVAERIIDGSLAMLRLLHTSQNS